MNAELDWNSNTEALNEKGRSSLRRIRSFGVKDLLLKTFFFTLCWYQPFSMVQFVGSAVYL